MHIPMYSSVYTSSLYYRYYLLGMPTVPYKRCIFVYSSYRREDSGLLIYKEHLPVSQVAVGDTNRPGSEAKLTVGPLRCQGDSKCVTHTYVLWTCSC